MTDSGERLIETIRRSIIGDDRVIEGPFGPRRLTYADYTASGRSLSFIEDYIRDEVMPLYANTHTETSGTGRQTGRFREDARDIIRQATGCTDDDALIFCGSGATAAVNKIVDMLNLRLPRELDVQYRLREQVPAEQRPVVFIGPYEHHSNELPWRESIADLVKIDEDADGHVDLAALEAALQRYADRPLKIGSFSAASNVTGIGTDTRSIAALLHKYNALSFWDFAAAGPYVRIEMNMRDDREDGHLVYKDAVFISPHKFIGGPGTPGILIVKKKLIQSAVPTVPGGGSVSFVNATTHQYHANPVRREEAGTPAIIESVRAGLVFQLKEAVGWQRIREREASFVHRAIARWRKNPNIQILGNLDAWRLSIVSFMVRHHEDYLHYVFVVAVLNDLLGVQARGGCSCAGPYGHRLLGIDPTTSGRMLCAILAGQEGVRPGWVRINFNYFISDAVFEFLLDAVDFVAEHAWKLLPYYHFNPKSGTWVHRSGRRAPVLRLGDICYEDGQMSYPRRHVTEPESALRRYLEEARRAVDEAVVGAEAVDAEDPVLSEEVERLRWFPLPTEVRAELLGAAPR